jgi:serine/threonine protein kinase
LGHGGNGVVWSATDGEGGTYALKVLHSRGKDRLARFRDEVNFLTLYDRPGVLPLVDSGLNERPPWYVMPLAKPIRKALGRDPAPNTVVEAIASIASVLAGLASEGIGHRDIKPDNLFRLNDSWVVGDFGLVTYPDKDPVTQHGRRLGPLDYMAPEMRANADTVNPEPVDVWSLAKTLWVLLAAEDLPLPGTHDLSNPAYSLAMRIDWQRINEVDLLLERCTQVDPTERLTMAEVATELQALLASPEAASSIADLADLSARLKALVTPAQRKLDAAGDRRRRCNDNWRELEELSRRRWHDLSRLLTFNGPHPAGGYRATSLLGKLTANPYASYEWGGQLTPPGDVPPVIVVIASAYRVPVDNERADLAAILAIDHTMPDRTRHTVQSWFRVWHDVPVGSAQQANAFAEIDHVFEDAIPETARICIDLLTSK